MTGNNWDAFHLSHALFMSTKSKDRSTQVGAVIVGPDHEVRSSGYNGFPRGVNDEADHRHERPLKYRFAEHAERNAIYNAARVGTPLKGCTLYVTSTPRKLPVCADCARAIIQAGIVRVVQEDVSSEADETTQALWGINEVREMFVEAGVEWDELA